MAERIRAWGVVGTVPRVAAVALVLFAILYVARDRQSAAGVRRRRLADDQHGIRARRPELVPRPRSSTGSRSPGLLFIVASGFSLIFGLMRVVNMAHGAFYLLGGYVAYEVQQRMTGSGFFLHRTR